MICHRILLMTQGDCGFALLPGLRMVRKVLVLLGILLFVSCLAVVLLSFSTAKKSSEIKALKSEIQQKSDEISTIRQSLECLKKEMENAQKAGESHAKHTIEAGNELIEKINSIEINSNARDWLDQPVPDAVVYNFNRRICSGSSN